MVTEFTPPPGLSRGSEWLQNSRHPRACLGGANGHRIHATPGLVPWERMVTSYPRRNEHILSPKRAKGEILSISRALRALVRGCRQVAIDHWLPRGKLGGGLFRKPTSYRCQVNSFVGISKCLSRGSEWSQNSRHPRACLGGANGCRIHATPGLVSGERMVTEFTPPPGLSRGSEWSQATRDATSTF